MSKLQLKSKNLQEILNKLIITRESTSKNENGKVLIIGGSSLFHGAPILALKAASRLAGMVFFTSPEPSLGEVAFQLKSKLASFIWVPWETRYEYGQKADVILIGPGMLRERNKQEGIDIKCQNFDKQGWETKSITEELLTKFPNKKWVIDAGALQVMDAKYIPHGAILTPNSKEYEMLFGPTDNPGKDVEQKAKKHQCIIVYKNNGVNVVSPESKIVLPGSVPMTKGGMGDVLAGLTSGLAAKNDSFVACVAAAYINQKAAERLYKRVGEAFNADDLVDEAPKVIKELL